MSDKSGETFDISGRRLAGLSASATGPVDQDKKGNYATQDREGRMPFIEGKAHPKDPGTTADSNRTGHQDLHQ